ncbi:hypothetical protein GCM10010207_80660 [Streptomyces atratus]|nr:hypothetical protein GCM10010207_80660 [Streptomyces atratus]
MGDPNDPDTFIGPMTCPGRRERVRTCIQLGIEEGARPVTGGPQIPEGLEKGNYVTPTVFVDVDNSMRIAREEIFGPVLVVIAYDDQDDAVRIVQLCWRCVPILWWIPSRRAIRPPLSRYPGEPGACEHPWY